MDSFNYVKGFDLFGVKARQIPCLTAKGEPSNELALKIGLLYINEDNGDMYKCVKGGVEEGLVWVKIINDNIIDALNDLEKKIPIKPEDIGAQPAGNYLTSAPVTSVNDKTGKITLSASDVGARPNTWIPTAEQVGADPKGTATSAISTHNTSNTAHNDLRLEIKAIREQLTAFLDVDEETLNELSELIERIVTNQTSIAQLTTSKVNTADIIDNLVTSASNKPLSASQGKELKTLIDDLTANKVDSSELNDAIYTELEVAHDAGMFKGDPGFSPYITFEEKVDGTYLVAHNETGIEELLIVKKEADNP